MVVALVFARDTSRSDPAGLGRAEDAEDCFLLGISVATVSRPWCGGQFQLSFPAKPRRMPRSYSDARSSEGNQLANSPYAPRV
jgi:hypothetical protein